MRTKMAFRPIVFVALLAVCGVIAGTAAWITGLSFWVLLAICVVAVLFNGVVATLEDKHESGQSQ